MISEPLGAAAWQVGRHAIKSTAADAVLANADEIMKVGDSAVTTWGELGGAAGDPAAAAKRLLVIGGGPAGNDIAIRAAQAGWEHVVVIDKHGQNPLRHTIFNLTPSVVDSQAKLAGVDSELLERMSPIVRRYKDDSVHDVFRVDNEGTKLLPEPGRATDAASLTAGFDGVDRRPWARISIQGLEASQRLHIAGTYNADAAKPNVVQMLFDTEVTAAEEGAHGIRLLATGSDGTRHAIDGAFAVSATGGRNPFGVRHVLFPEESHFIGGLTTTTTAENVMHPRMTRAGAELSEASQAANPPGRPYATVGLPWDGTHGLIWAGIDKPAASYSSAELRAVVRDRMEKTGHKGTLLTGDKALLPVSVQLGMVPDSARIATGRHLLAGDELIRPYFPTSTGGSHALGVNGPIVGETLRDVRLALDSGSDEALEAVLANYDTHARAEAREVEKLGRSQMLEDIGHVVPDFDESWAAAQRAADTSGVGTSAN